MLSKKEQEVSEMYALGALSLEQVKEYVASSNMDEAITYAHEYAGRYNEYLVGLEAASKYHLQEEYKHCIFALHMTPRKACMEWDIMPDIWLNDMIDNYIDSFNDK